MLFGPGLFSSRSVKGAKKKEEILSISKVAQWIYPKGAQIRSAKGAIRKKPRASEAPPWEGSPTNPQP